MPQPIDSLVTHRDIAVNGVRLHYVDAGSGPLVVLLHGFPEFWYGWRNQIPALAAAGYRVIAPDLRGYNRSEKPPGVAPYDAELIAADVAELIRASGAERATVVGHDWGGWIAWVVAMRYPALLERLAILNAPHPASTARGWRNPRQLARSWYIAFFQLPWLPERALRRGGYAAIRRGLLRGPRALAGAKRTQIRSAQVGAAAFTAADVARYVEAISQPGSLTAALNYYRALCRRAARRQRLDLSVYEGPTLVIWGEQDPYLGPALADPGERWAPRARVVRLPEAGHFVQADAPDRVNELLLEFLRETR